jgi:hypothetical protein
VPLIVKDRDGNFLLEVEGVNFLDSKNLRRADFSGLQLEGAHLSDSDLREADFTRADLYWANTFEANCEGAIFRDAELHGANMVGTNLRGADLRGAYISLDRLMGSPQLQGADLTEALLDGAVLIGCEYDNSTVFPSGFDPAAHGMIWIDSERIYISPGSFASTNLEPGYYLPNKMSPGSYIPWKRN